MSANSLARYFSIIACVTFLLPFSSAQKKPANPLTFVSPELLKGPSAATHERLRPLKLDERLFGDVIAAQDVDTGQVRRIEGKIRLPNAASEAESVHKFLQMNTSLLGISSEGGLQLLREIKSPGGDHFYYQQMYEGLPVWGGRLSVHNVRDSKASQVVNDLRKLPAPKATFHHYTFSELDRAHAIDVAQQTVKYDKRAAQNPTAEQGFLEVAGQPVQVWRVRFVTASPGAVWEVMIRAQDMKPLSTRNIAAYQQASAMIFRDDPIESTGIDTLTQSGSATALQGAREPVFLSDLDGTGQLDGKYASTKLTTAFQRAKSSSNPGFIFDWDDPRFRETMTYYWVTECIHYLQSLGFSNVFAAPIAIDVDGTKDDNSWYANGTLTFGSGGVPDAEDAEVIFHEMGHAIQDAQVPGLLADGGEEVRAISEGFGDYWAASFFGASGPKGAAWDIFFDKWDGITVHQASGGHPPFLRRLDGSKQYPNDLDGEVHDDGEIWSACLWKIRAILGRDSAARVILESNTILSPTSKFPDAARAILQANDRLNSSANSAAIRKIFQQAGIL